jgi:hypothetical protein
MWTKFRISVSLREWPEVHLAIIVANLDCEAVLPGTCQGHGNVHVNYIL